MEIKFQKVSFSYNRQENLIMDDISLKILDNRVTGIIGANGSGKTTLLKLISGEILPNKGKIVINDNILTRKMDYNTILNIKKLNGYLPQNMEETISSYTVKEEIISYLEEQSIDKRDIENQISNIFISLGIDLNLLSRQLYLLSDGERRKIMVASILVRNPEIIILDEPTVGLDNNGKKKLINYLTKLKKLQNKTIIISSNDIDFINKISDDVIVLEKGKVIKSEKKSEIFRDVKFFDAHCIAVPQIIKFEDIVLQEKGILLGYRDDVNDLVKDILRKC